MNKSFIMIVCICSMLLFGGCGLLLQTGDDSQRNEIHSLEVWSAAENDEWIYHVNYPHYYYGFNHVDMGETSIYDFEQAVPVEEISKEDFVYLRDYVLGLTDETEGEDSVFAYSIVFYYYDENGEYQRIYVEGYDELPEGFEKFTDKVNELCGGQYLTGSGSLQEVTPEFLAQVWGVTDEDVSGGTLADLIAQEEIDMKSLTELFNIRSALDGFYINQKAPGIDPYHATELRKAESTQAEYDAFVAEFEAKLSNIGYELKESTPEMQDQDNMIRYNNEFYVAKSSDLSKMALRAPAYDGGGYQIDLDAHMEGMFMSADFIYSRDGKFILIDCSDVDVQEVFVSCGK